MSKSVIAVALMISSVCANAAVTGASSKPANIEAKESTALPFGADRPGLAISGSPLVINLEDGPIKHINHKYSNAPINSHPDQSVDGKLGPRYLSFADINPVMGLFISSPLGQVWYEKRGYDTDVYSVRQIADPALPLAPKFGGLVIAKVPDLPAGTSVYFGEWAPRAGTPSTSSDTNLALNNAEHTVWYVGENPTGNTTGLGRATYHVIGTGQHTPGQNDFYTGELVAVFGSGAPIGSLSGSLTGTLGSISLNDTFIDNNTGTFERRVGTDIDVQGRFFGADAVALAGYTKNGTLSNTADDVAFGGKKQ